ncbi:MAG: outer membrane protein assembly factor BamA [Candidatus Aminicenantaceae bacterium]
MKKYIVLTLLVFIPFSLFGQEVIEEIEIIGNDRVTKETIKYYLSSQEGDFYSPELLRKDFRVLWATGFFSNIRMEEKTGQYGRIIQVYLRENPVIKDVLYKTGKRIKEDDIVNKLKEADEHILSYSYYSPHKVKRIEKTIKDLMNEKGLASGKVETDIAREGQNEVVVTFNIDEGPKVRVGKIDFVGDPKLKESTLLSAFKENKEHTPLAWIMGKDTFKQNMLSQDLQNLKKKLQEHGFMEADIGDPRIENFTKRSIFFKKQTMKKITIPVDAGYLYFVGDVEIQGNEFFSKEGLRTLIKMTPGSVYSISAREEAVKEIRELYNNFGYLYVQINPVERLDPKNKRVNVTFNIYEGEVAHLHRINFTGNTHTKDKVMRREMMIREGDRFSFEYFKNSLLRINQLGLVELEGDPEIQPNPEDPTQINVNVRVTEMQRNNIQFTAGYSGYYGTFLALSYSTVNFLGAGEKVELSLQYGKLIKNYSLGFSEPYFLDLPITLGFNLHDQTTILPGLYNRRGRGVNFNFGARVKGYWRTSLTYGFEYLDISQYEYKEGETPYYNPYYPYGGHGGGTSGYGYNPYYFGGYGFGAYNISSLSPSVYYNTVDSPLTPSRGSLYSAALKLAGGILGGDVSMIKPRFEWTRYQPVIGRSSLGFHIEYSFIEPLAGSAVPFWERFFLGGERSIRGYDIYTIGPRNEDGINMGGEKSLVLNAEYIIPVGGPLYAILFYDMGNAYAGDQSIDFGNMFTSMGLEARIFVPALRVPFRLIFSYNNRIARQGDSNFKFRFAIGTTF